MIFEGFRGCPSGFDCEIAPKNAMSMMFIGVVGVFWAWKWMELLLILILNYLHFSDVYHLTVLQAFWVHVRGMT